MKGKRHVIWFLLVLIVGLSVTPAMGGTGETTHVNTPTSFYLTTSSNEMVTLEVIDCTGSIPIKKVVMIPRSEWNTLRDELQMIREKSLSLESTFAAQISVFQKHHLISNDVNYESLLHTGIERLQHYNLLRNSLKKTTGPVLNNTIISAMCAINFEMTNGTTAVFGLNTFINYVGFDIVSFHYGYVKDGIETNGIFSKKNEPGKYLGFMFGFLGAWAGEKIATGFYSNVTVAGFSVITAWVPLFQ